VPVGVAAGGGGEEAPAVEDDGNSIADVAGEGEEAPAVEDAGIGGAMFRDGRGEEERSVDAVPRGEALATFALPLNSPIAVSAADCSAEAEGIGDAVEYDDGVVTVSVDDAVAIRVAVFIDVDEAVAIGD
jgi:hypothetical protein